MSDWESMVHFAIHLVKHAHKIKKDSGGNPSILDQRLMILNLDHANELIMKAFLIREGFVIEEIDASKIKTGVRTEDIISTFTNKKKTIRYLDCLYIVSRLLNIDSQITKKFEKFHEIRNEIQHRSLNIPLNKEEEIREFYPHFVSMYHTIIQGHTDWLSHLPPTI